ncbi:MAG: hypothetical protein M1821_003652 [Bathelium mastoideum]|nr:MAG: hypothetical protein M1821_003652 [Bathelium mastoideum]
MADAAISDFQQSPQRATRPFSRTSSHNTDSLWEDLSPTKTLNVFLAGSEGDSHIRRDTSGSSFGNGIQTASPAEKAFGVRCARTASQLRAWCWELEAWDWSGSFEVPSLEQRTAKKRRVQTVDDDVSGKDADTYGRIQGSDNPKSFASSSGMDDDDGEESNGVYWGSLEASQAQHHEKRVDEIQEQLDDMDVEDLKNHLLDVHVPSRSRQSSVSGLEHMASLSTYQLKHLDDYTALITATIMRALPYLSRLTLLLHIWSLRLSVLRKSSSFLSRLKDAQSALQMAWSLIDTSAGSGPQRPFLSRGNFNRDVFNAIRLDLHEKVTFLGQMLDRMLDELEGRKDTIPDRWIDEFETLETGYSSWVVEAGGQVLGVEAGWPTATGSELADLAGKSSQSDEHHFEATKSDEIEDQVHNTKHDTLTEPLRISIEKANKQDSYEKELKKKDYTLGAALSSHPPSNPHSATHDHVTAPVLFPTVNPIPAQSSPEPLDLRLPPSDAGLSFSTSSEEAQEDLARTSFHEAEPKTLVPDPVTTTTSTLSDGRKGLSAKLSALMGREEKPPTMRPTNTPVRPFERANSGFGRLFNKQRERSESAASSSSESRQRSRSGSTRPRSRRLNVRAKRDAATPDAEEPSSKVSEKAKESLGLEKQTSKETVESLQSASNRTSSPDAALRRDLSEIQRAADFLESEQRLPSGGMWEQFVARPVAEPELSYFDQEHSASDQLIHHGNELEETFEPNMPVATDDFYDKFVDSLPASPSAKRGSSANEATGNIQRPGFRERLFSFQDTKGVKTSTQRRLIDLPPPLTKRHTIQGLAHPNSQGFTVTASHSTNLEQAHAALVGVTESERASSLPIVPDTDSTVNLGVAQETLADAARKSEEEPSTFSNQDSESLKSKKHLEDSRTGDTAEVSARQPILKRASVTSIESFPRSELKSVEIRRTDSQCSRDSRSVSQTPVSPVTASFPEGSLQRPQSSRSTTPQKDIAPIPRKLSSHARSLSTTEEEESQQVRHVSELMKTPSSPTATNFFSNRQTGDNATPQHEVRQPSNSLRNTAEETSKPSVQTASKRSTHGRVLSEQEQLERQISSILTTIPASIRLASGSTEESVGPKPQPQAKRLALTSGPLTPAKTRNVGSTRSSIAGNDSPNQPILTLTRARPTPSSRASQHSPHTEGATSTTKAAVTTAPSQDTGVTLYHLHQPGRVDPIRLFVRRVGDARVMVRVGGGWADLGDFLREFASHHGRRAASAEHVEMVGIDGAVDRRRAVSGSGSSGGGGAGTPGTGAASRPSSSGGASRLLESRLVATPGTPTPVPAGGSEPDEVVRVREQTPSSTGSARIRILEDETTPERVPLSGPVAAKRAMSVEKQKWVQDMLGQARKVSSERVERVGGTKRVVFRGLSNASIGGDGKEKKGG